MAHAPLPLDHDAPSPLPQGPSSARNRPLAVGAALMALGGLATGGGLVLLTGGPLGDVAIESLWSRVLSPDGAFYKLAVVFLLVATWFLATRTDAEMPLTFAAMAVAALALIPLSVLALDVAPFTLGHLTSGSLRQLVVIYSPLVAGFGLLLALYGYWRSAPTPRQANLPVSPPPRRDLQDRATR